MSRQENNVVLAAAREAVLNRGDLVASGGKRGKAESAVVVRSRLAIGVGVDVFDRNGVRDRRPRRSST